ncbi:MAG: InlB B-repeat-containing protein, partial [Bacilli bacterium]|nr:InlB B-repeat-containing protein [Bacilli bacterium]
MKFGYTTENILKEGTKLKLFLAMFLVASFSFIGYSMANATYAANYTITFNPRGGTFGGTTSTSTKTVTTNSSTNNSVGSATRSGYTFAGWWTSDGIQVYDSSGDAVVGASTTPPSTSTSSLPYTEYNCSTGTYDNCRWTVAYGLGYYSNTYYYADEYYYEHGDGDSDTKYRLYSWNGSSWTTLYSQDNDPPASGSTYYAAWTDAWGHRNLSDHGASYWPSGSSAYWQSSGGSAPTTASMCPSDSTYWSYSNCYYGMGYYSGYNYYAISYFASYDGNGNSDDYTRYQLYQWNGSSWTSVYSDGSGSSGSGSPPASGSTYYAAWNDAWGHRSLSDHGASYLQSGGGAVWVGTSSITVYAKWTKTMTGTSMTSSISPTSYIYDGSGHCPTPTVKDGSTTLTSGTDYSISCSNNTSVGTATATLSGSSAYNSTTMAYYTGSTAETFYINRATITFNANGGTLSGSSTLYAQSGSSKLWDDIRAAGQAHWADAPTASKTGTTFNGWWTASSGGSRVLSGGEISGTVSGYTDGTNWTTTQNRTLYAQFTLDTPGTTTISGGATKIYGASATTLTCSNSTSYGSGISKYYSFGYASSDGGSPGNWTTASTSNTLSISATEYVGQRWYSCRVYASDGTNTSGTSTSSTASDTEMTINNATLTFNATSNGGTGGGTVYTKTGATVVYNGIRSTTTTSIPTASKTGWTFSGWYSGATSGSQVLTSAGAFTGTAVSGYTSASAWAATSNQTLYARYTINTPGTTTISGGSTKIYGASATTLTCSNSTSYASGTTKYYQFGYATSDGGTPGNWTTASTSNTTSIASDAYVGQRWYSCRVYASDGTSTSGNSTSATASDTEMTINNATLTFDKNGGASGGGTVYTKTGATAVYNGIRSTTTTSVPTVTAQTGYTFQGWYNSSSGGSKVLTSAGAFTGTAVSGYTSTNAWAATTNKTLYAQYTLNTPGTTTISGGATKIYGASATTLTCSNSTSYASGVSKYYSFGYATSDGGTPGSWTTASTTNTLSISATEYVGSRWYSCRVYATDGTLTSSTSTSATTADTQMTLNNATITFNANGGTLSGTSPLYARTGSAKLWDSIDGVGQAHWADAPTASHGTGSTFTGWWTASSGGSKVLTTGGDIAGTVSGYADGTNWTTTQNRTLYAQYTLSDPATPTISGGATKVYGSSATTLTCSTTTTYGSGISKYYSFGYATSDGGTPSNWTTASTTATISVAADAYVGQRWYSCRVYATDGTATSNTSTSATTADTEMTINNATLTFNATSNGGTGGGTVYTKTGATGVYTTIRGTTAGSIPSVSKTGWTMSGWYSGASSGSKVLNADGSFTGSAVTNYTTASAWATTANQTLYARYTINTPGTTTISGGATKIYGASATTLTCSNSTSYASGTSKYYSFGYATSDGGTPGSWTTASTSNTLTISATEYVGQRWYSCRVYASDGTSTSSNSTSATTADTEMTINNATLTFNATSNGGTGGGTVYTKTGATGVYTTIRGTTAASIPTATAPTGYTMSGWYTSQTGGSK